MSRYQEFDDLLQSKFVADVMEEVVAREWVVFGLNMTTS